MPESLQGSSYRNFWHVTERKMLPKEAPSSQVCQKESCALSTLSLWIGVKKNQLETRMITASFFFFLHYFHRLETVTGLNDETGRRKENNDIIPSMTLQHLCQRVVLLAKASSEGMDSLFLLFLFLRARTDCPSPCFPLNNPSRLVG